MRCRNLRWQLLIPRYTWNIPGHIVIFINIAHVIREVPIMAGILTGLIHFVVLKFGNSRDESGLLWVA